MPTVAGVEVAVPPIERAHDSSVDEFGEFAKSRMARDESATASSSVSVGGYSSLERSGGNESNTAAAEEELKFEASFDELKLTSNDEERLADKRAANTEAEQGRAEDTAADSSTNATNAAVAGFSHDRRAGVGTGE